jgi:imidazolonepropionase-like amidohydrolase
MAPQRTYLRAPWVIDGRGGPPIEDGVVAIQGGTIAAVRPAREVADLEGVELREFPGGAILPGMIDAHAHLSLAADKRPYEQMYLDPDEMLTLISIRNLQLHLASGVTTLRDNGARNRVTFVVREAINRGYFVGPRLLLSGRPVTHSGGHFHFCNGTADGIEQIQRAVRELIAEGADHIKIMASGGATAGNQPFYASYGVPELRAAVETAHELGRLTTAHCRARNAMERAVEAGLDCIEHAEFLVPGPEVMLGSGRIPPAVTDYDPHLTERMLESGMYISFTFQTDGWDSVVALREKRDREGRLSEAEQGELGWLERFYEKKCSLFARLREDGFLPRLVVSSDAGPFDTEFGRFHYNTDLAVMGGMSPMQAIESVTRVAAQACGISEIVGTLEAGKSADIVVVRGNPLDDIANLANVDVVFQAGVQVVSPGRHVLAPVPGHKRDDWLAAPPSAFH